jgi:hypothetical protein
MDLPKKILESIIANNEDKIYYYIIMEDIIIKPSIIYYLYKYEKYDIIKNIVKRVINDYDQSLMFDTIFYTIFLLSFIKNSNDYMYNIMVENDIGISPTSIQLDMTILGGMISSVSNNIARHYIFKFMKFEKKYGIKMDCMSINTSYIDDLIVIDVKLNKYFTSIGNNKYKFI